MLPGNEANKAIHLFGCSFHEEFGKRQIPLNREVFKRDEEFADLQVCTEKIKRPDRNWLEGSGEKLVTNQSNCFIFYVIYQQ